MTMRALPLERRHRLLLGLAGAALAAALAVRFLYLPVQARIAERRATLQALRAKIADAQFLMQQREDQDAAWRRAEARYEVVRGRFGDGQSVARILDTIGAQAQTHQLELVAVQPRADDREQRTVRLGPEVTLREVPLSVQLTGRYRQLGQFLGALPEAPYVAAVSRLTVTRPQAESPRLSAQLELALYLSERAATP